MIRFYWEIYNVDRGNRLAYMNENSKQFSPRFEINVYHVEM